ncbi:hypothetical protein A6A12_1904 [Vibrio anguillarum]|nr:hypothetical protein A6A12_1904 [Vibrio anguillarum]
MNCFKVDGSNEDGSNKAEKATSPDLVSVLLLILSLANVSTFIGNNQQSS